MRSLELPGSCLDRSSLHAHLPHGCDPVRERRPTPGVRVRARRGRPCGSCPTIARPVRPLPRRHRRVLAQERHRRRSRWRDHERVRGSSRRRVRGTRRAARDHLRRLHPHQPRPPPSSRGRTALAGVRAQWRSAPARVHGGVLRRLRAVLRGPRARRRPLPRARRAGGHRGRDELVLPPLGLHRPPDRTDRDSRARHHAGAVPRRDPRVRQAGVERHQRVAFESSAPVVGGSRCPATRPK